jgi:hypothetical protein
VFVFAQMFGCADGNAGAKENCSSAADIRERFHLKLGQSSCCQFHDMSDSVPFYRSLCINYDR